MNYFSAMQLRAFRKRLVVAGTLLIWLIKLLIRPYLHSTGTTGFLLGIAPNLLGSFLVPFGAYWLFTQSCFNNGHLLRLSGFADTRLVCLSGFVLLLINEYLQKIPFFGRTFDYYDIISSVVGLFAAYYCISALQRRQALALG